MILVRPIRVSLAAAILPLLITSCTKKADLEGKYSGGMFDIDFKDHNKANVILAGGSMMEIDYEISGKEVKLKMPYGTTVGSITDAGCLNLGEAIGTLCKQGSDSTASTQ